MRRGASSSSASMSVFNRSGSLARLQRALSQSTVCRVSRFPAGGAGRLFGEPPGNGVEQFLCRIGFDVLSRPCLRPAHSRSPFRACAVMAMIGMWTPICFSRRTDQRRRFKAVHLRHLHIHQHQIERPRFSMATASRPVATTTVCP